MLRSGHPALPPRPDVRGMGRGLGLPDRLRSASIAQLEDFCVQLEKAVFLYDLKTKEHNDAALAKTADGLDASTDRKVAVLLSQRKTALIAILKTTKRALAIRRGRRD